MSLFMPPIAVEAVIARMERRDFNPPEVTDVEPFFRRQRAQLQNSLVIRFITDDRRQALDILHDELQGNDTGNAILNAIQLQDDAELGRIVRRAFYSAATDAIDEAAARPVEL